MNDCKPEFAIGDTVTYMPFDQAYQATVLTYRYIGAGTHPDEVKYLIRVEGDVLEADWVATCREIYESAMYKRSHSISWD
jgi:hypothetical protein